jgi:hypothetical protein
MSWIKIDDGLLEHPKFIRAARSGGSAALHLWLALSTWCSRHLSDGEVPHDMIESVGGPRGAKVREKAFRALTDALLLLRRVDGGYTVVDYLQYNPSRTQVLEQRRRKAESQKDYIDRKKLTSQHPPARTNHQSAIDEVPPRPVPGPKITSSSDSPLATSEASESRIGSGENRESALSISDAATMVFDCWQAVHGKEHSKFDAKRKARIKARLREAFTVEQLCQAIRGATKDPFLMGRDPKAARAFDGIETLLRDAAQVERLIALEDGTAGKACSPMTEERWL